MDIKLGHIVANVDLFKTGRITVAWEDYPNGLDVKYVSPYGNSQSIGFIAIPEVGMDVLICKPNNQNQWYYMGTILENFVADAASTDKIVDEGVRDPYITPYRFRGVIPQSYLFSSPKGNKVMLSDAYSQTGSHIGAYIETSRGMRLTMDDSTGTITLGNSTNNALVTITENSMSDQTAFGGPASFSVQVTGNVSITSQQGDLDLTVINGRTINIENKSGLGSGARDDSRIGNINIVSKFGDVTVEAQGNDQQINVLASGQDGNINMTADGAVRVSGRQGVFINSSDGDINIVGNKIYLN